MATWNRVSAKASTSVYAKPDEKTVSNAASEACRKSNSGEYVAVKYNKLVERVLLLERNAIRAQNPARLEAQLTRIENKIKENYKKATTYEEKLKQQFKNNEGFDERCKEIIKKLEMKLFELETRTEEILSGAAEMKAEMKELHKDTVNSAFDTCMIYHNLKQTSFRPDGDYTLEEKQEYVREHCA